MRNTMRIALRLGASWLLLLQASCGAVDGGRCGFWVDMYRGEPVTDADVLEDLAGVRVVYIGEYHRLARHHALQEQIVTELAQRGVSLVLGLEMLEHDRQPILDRYNRGEIDFDQLAEETQWSKRWPSFADYRPAVEAAHRAGAPILALNARAETVRLAARQGIDGLDPESRAELPADVNLDDLLYESHMQRVMMVHAHASADMMRRMFEAQVTRDETMADRLCVFLNSEAGRERTAVVICGAGHVSHGLGIPSRVRRRMPEIEDRIIVLSSSGDVELSAAEQAMAREITITHGQLRELDRPLADYLHATNLKPEAAAQE